MHSSSLKNAFPLPWHGLYGAMVAVENQLFAMETWLKKVQHSRHGDRLNWADLIDCLVNEEPLWNKDRRDTINVPSGKLYFAPIFYHLPALAQNHLLCFLFQHRDEITSRSLQSLCDVLCAKNDSNALPKSDWVPFWLQKISHYLAVQKVQSDGLKCEASLGQTYHFTEANEDWKERIVKRLKARTESDDSRDQERVNPWRTALWKDATNTARHLSASTSQRELESASFNANASVWSQEPSVDMDTTDFFLSQMTQGEVDSVAKRRRIEKLNQELLPDSAIEDHLDDRLKACGKTLKEAWYCTPVEEVSSEDLITLADCTLLEVQLLSRYINLSDIPEANLSAVATSFSSLREQLPLSHAENLTRECMLDKVLALDAACPRSLHAACVSLVEAYPRAVVSAVLVPTLAHEKFGSYQCDLLLKLIKETLGPEYNQHLLREYLEIQSAVTPAVLPVLQAVIDTKTVLDEPSLDLLVGVVSNSAHSLSDNLKYGKVLLALIKTYITQLDQTRTRKLQEAAESHKTFLKKSITAALKKAS